MKTLIILATSATWIVACQPSSDKKDSSPKKTEETAPAEQPKPTLPVVEQTETPPVVEQTELPPVLESADTENTAIENPTVETTSPTVDVPPTDPTPPPAPTETTPPPPTFDFLKLNFLSKFEGNVGFIKFLIGGQPVPSMMGIDLVTVISGKAAVYFGSDRQINFKGYAEGVEIAFWIPKETEKLEVGATDIDLDIAAELGHPTTRPEIRKFAFKSLRGIAVPQINLRD